LTLTRIGGKSHLSFKTESSSGLVVVLIFKGGGRGKKIVKPLFVIFSKSLDDGVVPHDWMAANVTPIFKKGSKKDPANYRPVSLTSQIGKIFQRIVKAKIMNFLETNHLICHSQHGIRPKGSCLTNLLKFMEIVL